MTRMSAMREKRRLHVVCICLILTLTTSLGQDMFPTEGINATNQPELSNSSLIDPLYDNGGVIQNGSAFSASERNTTEDPLELATTLDSFIFNDTEVCPIDSLLPCVTKCCPYGQSLGSNKKCTKSNVRFIPQFTILVNGFNDTSQVNETETRGGYNLIIQNVCRRNRYRLEPFSEPTDEFQLLFNGSLWLPEMKPNHVMLPSNHYCMEVFEIDSEEIMLPLVCNIIEPVIIQSSFHFILYPMGLLCSVPFLFCTFVVYIMLAELRNLHGKCLACYTICLAVSYILLSAVQLGGNDFSSEVCISMAFAVQFSFTASFFWLNMLCFNTWRVVYFHEGDLSHRLHKTTERVYFLFYSIYAWSCTIIFIIVTMVMNFTPTIPSSFLKPKMGEKRCWFGTEAAAISYFYGPIGALIVANIILFIMTVGKLVHDHRHKEICIRTPKETIKLCVTFFFMMGINWVMELISWAAGGPNFIWYVTDICNTLQGVVIYAVFVMDKVVWELCQTKLIPKLAGYIPCCKGRYTAPVPEPIELSVSNYEAVNGEVTKTYNFPEKDQESEK